MIKDNTERINTSKEKLKTDLEQTKTALTDKKVEVAESVKFSEVPALIESIKVSEGKLVITATGYDGEELTATKGEKSYKGTVSQGTCTIPIDEDGEWTVSAKDGNSVSITVNMEFKGELIKNRIYGVKVTEAESEPAKRLTYIDDAVDMLPVTIDKDSGKGIYNDWDKTWIFDKIYPVMLKRDGTIDYRLDPNDYSKRLDNGQASDVANINYDGNAMVCIEKFYTKFSMDGENEVIEVSENPAEGFEPIGFIREDGSEADKVFIHMFMGSYDSSGRLRSISGQSIKQRLTYNNFRTAAQKNGSGYDIDSWALSQLIGALYLILIRNRKVTYSDEDSNRDPNSKTGLVNLLGAISKTSGIRSIKFLHIEDFICSQFHRFENGLLGVANENAIYIRMKPPYSGTSYSTYTKVTDYVNSSMQEFISKMKCSNDFGRYPVEYKASYTNYEVSSWFNVYKGASTLLAISVIDNSYNNSSRYICYPADFSFTNYDYYTAGLTYLPPAA